APRRNLRARLNGGGDQGHQECHANERSMGHGPPRLALVRGGINRRSRDSTGRRSAVENPGLIRDTRTVMMPARKRRDRFTAILVAVALLATFLCAVLSGCGKDDAVVKPTPNYRTYFMGFSSFPPKLSIASILETIDAFAPHSDYGMILAEPPWDSLLAGRPPDSLIRANQVGLAAYFRSKGLRVLVSIDPTNGLDRASDAAPLVAAGRSLTEPAIQALFRSYVTAMDTLVHPDYLGVASETNLIRLAAPAPLYDAVVAVANGAAADVRAH